MVWFYIKEVENGSVFNYVVENHLVDVGDSEKVKLLETEPNRFRRLNEKEVARLRAASSLNKVKTEKAEKAEKSKEVEKASTEVNEEKAEPEDKPVSKKRKRKKKIKEE